MKPVQYKYSDAIMEVLYLDGVAVDQTVREMTGRDLAGSTLIGSQRRKRHWFKRSCRLDLMKKYYVRNIIMIDLDYHVMVADNPDFENWQHYTMPFKMLMAAAGIEMV